MMMECGVVDQENWMVMRKRGSVMLGSNRLVRRKTARKDCLS